MMTDELSRIADELSSLAELGIKKAKAKGAEESEVFVSNVNTLSISIKTGAVVTRQGTSLGIGIRAVLGKKVGFAATSGADEAQIEHTAQEAVDVAKIRPLDPKFNHLADPVKIASKDGIMDDKVLGLSETDALKEVSMLSKTAFEYDKRVRALFGSVVVQKGAFAVANSRGVAGCSKGAGMGGGVYLTAVERGKQKTGSESVDTRKLVGFSDVGSKAARRAIKMLESKPLRKSLRTTVVWENVAIAPLLQGMLNEASNARNVQEGKSFFKDRLGQKVASGIFTALDDGQLPEGLQTFRVDTEGIPLQTTTLIEKGVLKGYIYDSYSAIQEHKESTGAGSRNWPEPFLSTPIIQTSNLVLKPGAKDLDGLMREVDEGVLVTDFVMGAGHANMTTGEFSVVAPSAFLIEKGDVKNPLEPVTIAGNFFNSLRNITKIGSDSKITGAGKIPSLIISDLSVSG
jgi:PmbA protein